jgi:2-polyprenyl-3-methyl-5-hydroxy-6-metoxy-1,4-benzoquinol methylase
VTGQAGAEGFVVERILAACGGGRVLCLGANPLPIARAFRRRAVPATPHVVEPVAGGVSLPFAASAFDLVCTDGVLEQVGDRHRRDALAELLRVSRGAVLLQEGSLSREQWERLCLELPCRKHPLHQLIVPYEGLDWERPRTSLLIERLPDGLETGRTVQELRRERDLHMDMLREAGRRADAHVARYMLARQFVRPGDRVLDAACGLGYGSAILNDGTLAESVLGVDRDEWAIRYAREHFGTRRHGLSFETDDIAALTRLPPSSLDVVVSFETLEHIADPEAFLATCQRLLTPGGRLVCSVPNEWVNSDGVDPNPHHLHVFNREKLERMCRPHFTVEHTFAQTAGGGMKHPDAGRTLREAGGDGLDAEWWLLVGMTAVSPGVAGPLRHGLVDMAAAPAGHVLAFDRDYGNPWLVRAMVTIGLRTVSASVLTGLAADTLQHSAHASADAGAALCVLAYRHLETNQPIAHDLLTRIQRYVTQTAEAPHAFRWQVSLEFVLGLHWLSEGDPDRAASAFEACATRDALRFSPHLATKTVGAAFLRGWLAAQTGDGDRARLWWARGIEHAERALHRPWEELLVSRERPALFGLREAALIVDAASQCATGLSLLHHADRPGILAAQLFESLVERSRRGNGSPTPAKSAIATTGDRAGSWSLLGHIGDARLVADRSDQLSEWDAMIGGECARSVFLHPPAVLTSEIPTGAAGRIATSVAIHPDAWGKPNTSACVFSVSVDDAVSAAVVLDPHRREADRRWIDLALDVPSTDRGHHRVRLETQTTGRRDFGWALFKDVTFRQG